MVYNDQSASSSIPDFYKILQVPPTATPPQIKSAYKKLALQFHPDKNKNVDAEDKFKSIQKAYEILSDPSKRLVYDSKRRTEERSRNKNSTFFENNTRTNPAANQTPPSPQNKNTRTDRQPPPPHEPNRQNFSDNQNTYADLHQRLVNLRDEYDQKMALYEVKQRKYNLQSRRQSTSHLQPGKIGGNEKLRRERQFYELQKEFNEAEKLHFEKEKVYHQLNRVCGYDPRYCEEQITFFDQKIEYCQGRIKFYEAKLKDLGH